MIHMLRVFFTGAYRKPREVNWLIGITLFSLALIEGLFGYSLPDDQLSGAGLRIFEGTLQGIPIVGTYLAYFLFGGPFPGHDIVPRMYIIHVLLVPGILLALIGAHIFIMFWQKHTQMPAKGNTERNVTGQPSYPYFVAKTSAWFIFIFGALALLATFASDQPDLAVRAVHAGGHLLGFPARLLHGHPGGRAARHARLGVELPRAHGHVQRAHTVRAATGHHPRRGGILAVLRAVGHRRQGVPPHQRPAAERPGAHRHRRGRVAFYGVLWIEGANDVVADKLQIPLYTVTWIARVAVIVGPIIAYVITKRICLGLQRKDRDELLHGYESGIIRQLPDGEFIEVHQPANEERLAVLEAKKVPALLPGARLRGRQRRAAALRARHARQGQGGRQPRLRRDHPGRGRRARQRPSRERARGDRRGARGGRRPRFDRPSPGGEGRGITPRPVRGQAGSPFRVNDDSRFIARASATTVTMAPMTTDVSTPRPASRAGSLARPLAMPRP